MRAQRALACAILALFLACAARAEFSQYRTVNFETRALAGGVAYERYTLSCRADPEITQVLHVLRADRAALSRTEILAYTNAGGIAGLSTVSEKAAHVPGAFAGVNGDFFDVTSGGGCGWLMTNGAWRASSEYGLDAGLGTESWALLINERGEASILQPRLAIFAIVNGRETRVDALNQLCASADAQAHSSGGDGGVAAARWDNELVLYTADWGGQTPGIGRAYEVLLDAGGQTLSQNEIQATVVGAARAGDGGGFRLCEGAMALSAYGGREKEIMSLRAGDKVRIVLRYDSALAGAKLLIGGGRHDGGPILVRNGKRAQEVPAEKQNLFDAPARYQRHARTCAGVDSQGGVCFAVCQGYLKDGSAGVTIEEMKTLMLELGMTDALNLDGGWSSVMVGMDENGNIAPISTPGGPAERPVANAILLRQPID